MSTGYGVVVIPLINAPADLRAFGQRFTPGFWENRGVGSISTFFETFQEAIPAPLTCVFDSSHRSHIDFKVVRPIANHHIIAIERFQSHDELNLDLLILHIGLETENLILFDHLGELRSKAKKIISHFLQMDPEFVESKRRGFSAVQSVEEVNPDFFIVFESCGMKTDRDVMTWGCETLLLAAVQHFAAQKVFENLPKDVESLASKSVILKFKLFADKYWAEQFLLKDSAVNLLEKFRTLRGTSLLAKNLIRLYQTNLEYFRNRRLNLLNWVVFSLGIAGLVLSFVTLIL